MSTTKRAWCGLLTIGVLAGWAYAGPLTGVNLLVNGEFEDDEAWTPVPTGWDLWTNAPAGWNGVVPYQCMAGHPKPRPDGQGDPYNVYGTFMVWYDTATGIIDQTVEIGESGGGPLELWVGGWIYTASLSGAYVKFDLQQGDTEWTSGEVFEPGNWSGWWSWFEAGIPASEGFVAGAVTLAVTINLAPEGPPSVGMHAMFVDGLQLEGRVLAPPQPTAWRSVRHHGPAGELPIVLDAAATGQTADKPTIETRRGGIQKIVVDFDQPVQVVDTIAAEDELGGHEYQATQVALVNGNTRLEIQFAAGLLPDETCYVIDLAQAVAGVAGQGLGGDADCMIRSLVGDINDDGKTDLTDMALAKSVNGAPLEGPNVRFDVNIDSRIDLTDMALIKSLNGGAVSCP